MSETLDEIEYRLSPDHMKNEAKDFLNKTADELRAKYHPKRIAKQAGRNMKNTISEHPVPSVIAGLSIGYLLIKSGEERSHRRHMTGEHYTYRPSSARRTQPMGDVDYREGRRRSVSEPPPGGYPREEPRGHHEESAARKKMHTASEKTKEVKEGATEKAREMKEEATEWAEETSREAQRQVRSAKHSVKRETRQVQRQMQDFIYDNPLMAGALALGAGAMLGGMLPSTRTEDEWMGEARDDVMERAERATEGTMHRAREAAENVAEEAKSAAKDVAETTKEEAKEVAEEGKESGKTSSDKGRQSKQQSGSSGSNR